MPQHGLLIEDKSEDALLVKKHLTQSGDFSLHWVMDGEEAVRFVKREGEFKDAPSPNLILLDLKLPGRMDGFSFLEWCRNKGPAPTTPVVVLTASPLPQDMRRAATLGVSSYLTKPVNWKRLGEQIAQLATTEFGSPYDEDTADRLMRKDESCPRELVCVLTFPDGRKITVRAAAEFVDEEVPFRYEGDTSLLRPFAPSGTLGFFGWYMEAIASNLGADAELFEE